MATYSIIGTPTGSAGIPVVLEAGIPAGEIRDKWIASNKEIWDWWEPESKLGMDRAPRWYLHDEAAAQLHPTLAEYEESRPSAPDWTEKAGSQGFLFAALLAGALVAISVFNRAPENA